MPEFGDPSRVLSPAAAPSEPSSLEPRPVPVAAVLARDDRAGEKRLVAYITARAPESAVSSGLVSTLRTHLSARLPDFLEIGRAPCRHRVEGPAVVRALGDGSEGVSTSSKVCEGL